MTEVPKPLDAALDLLVFAPVGLAMTAAEEIPKLAAKGRTRVNTQLMMARVVGQFAVTKGRQEFEKRFAAPAPSPSAETAAVLDESGPEPPVTFDQMTANGSSPAGSAVRDLPVAGEDVAVSTADDLAGLASVAEATPAPARSVSSAGDLAIHGYDSLSASQVVQRLAGLSSGELDAVGAYEQAHRGRRTILNRIDQLHAP